MLIFNAGGLQIHLSQLHKELGSLDNRLASDSRLDWRRPNGTSLLRCTTFKQQKQQRTTGDNYFLIYIFSRELP